MCCCYRNVSRETLYPVTALCSDIYTSYKYCASLLENISCRCCPPCSFARWDCWQRETGCHPAGNGARQKRPAADRQPEGRPSAPEPSPAAAGSAPPETVPGAGKLFWAEGSAHAGEELYAYPASPVIVSLSAGNGSRIPARFLFPCRISGNTSTHPLSVKSRIFRSSHTAPIIAHYIVHHFPPFVKPKFQFFSPFFEEMYKGVPERHRAPFYNHRRSRYLPWRPLTGISEAQSRE